MSIAVPSASYLAGLEKVRRRAKRLDGSRVLKLRGRYIRARNRFFSGAALSAAEKVAWRKAQRCGRAQPAAMALQELAAVSTAARNAGLAVLVRDQISHGMFLLLTRVWRWSWLRLPPAPRPQRKRKGVRW